MRKTWFITGCSTGFGRSIAQAVLNHGWNAVVTARDITKIQSFQDRFPDQALILPLDVTDTDAIKTAVNAALQRFGTIDVLVNNAGYGYRAAVEEGEKAGIDLLFATNFFGPVALMQEVLPTMRKNRSGAIVNFSSVAALRTFPGSGYYGASKCALEGVSDALSKEVSPLGIKVMVVEPGAFRTDFSGRSLKQSPAAISDYAETAGKRRIENDKTHGTQPGDPDKGAELLIEAIESENPPFRLLLGTDAVELAHTVLTERLEELEQWRPVSRRSDF